ncbi:MAG: metallophosphoesterase [Jiangellaceae bacterium]
MREQRPRDLSPTELGFTPQKAVPWLNPGLLVSTGIRTVFSDLFGAYLDKREMQAVLGDNRHDHSDAEELWLDYTADVGDGFDATYSIASLLARPTLAVDGLKLPRGNVLVLGGDQVYPTASGKAYGNRWKGPYTAALPVRSDQTPALYAIPGNHDWYDGLTAFLRLFAQGEAVGGWQTRQSRSYFALNLPHRWWLFGLDTQLDVYLDKPQLRYFEAAAKDLQADDLVILCAARPTWVISQESPDAYDSIDYFVRTIVEPTGARVPLMLSGDFHHYARYAGDGPDGRGRQLVTCGGGGAYLVGTAHLPESIAVPPATTVTRKASEPQRYGLAGTFPTAVESRRLGWTVFGRLPWRNPGFLILLGLMQTLLMFAMRTGHGRWTTAPIVIAVVAVFAGTILFATVQALDRARPRHWVAALLHGVPHVALGVAGAAVWSELPLSQVPNPWHVVLALLVYAPVVAVLDAWIVSAYLLVSSRFQVNVNELYAGMGIEDHKSFLRLHIGADGSLTLYPVAVDRVVRRWRANHYAPDDAPWIVPEGEELSAHLAEPPVTL